MTLTLKDDIELGCQWGLQWREWWLAPHLPLVLEFPQETITVLLASAAFQAEWLGRSPASASWVSLEVGHQSHLTLSLHTCLTTV